MTKQTDVAVVFGTRPEATKLISVVEALRTGGATVALIATGQHSTLVDRALMARLTAFADSLFLLGTASDGSLVTFLQRVRKPLARVLRELKPRVVLVQGDTTSAYAGARAAQDAKVPIAHVEAGVRSGSLSDPWPEELIRIEIDEMAALRYAPTTHALQNLHKARQSGAVTGNTGIDVLCETRVQPRAESTKPLLLLTLHRRELRQRLDARELLATLAAELSGVPCEVLWPVHPAMRGLAESVRWPPNVRLVDPLPYHLMIPTLAAARGLLTDSGGLVEEAAHLGVPTAILRDANDRPEAVEAGIAVQRFLTPEGIKSAVEVLANAWITRAPASVYGDGHAGERVARHLLEMLALAPTNEET